MKISNFFNIRIFYFSTYFMFIFNLTNDKPLKVASQHQTKNNPSNKNRYKTKQVILYSINKISHSL